MATMIFLAKNLTTLDLSEASFELLSCVLNRLDRINQLTAVNLSIMNKPLLRRMRRTGEEPTTSLGEIYNPIRASTIADLTTKCIRLTDLVLCGANLSQDAIVQICHLVSQTVTAINFARERVKNEHIAALVLRCPNMKYMYQSGRNPDLILNIPKNSFRVAIFNERPNPTRTI